MSMPTFSAIVMFLGLVPALVANEKQIVKVYPVADLVVPIQGIAGWSNNNKTACPATVGCAAQCAIKNKATHEEHLIRLICHTVKPASWSEAGGDGTIDYFPLGMGLVVRQSEDVHRELKAMLDDLRRFQETQVSMDFGIISVPESFFYERIGVDFNFCDFASAINGPKSLNAIMEGLKCGKNPIFLSDKELKTFLSAVQENRGGIVGGYNLRTVNGQDASSEIGQIVTDSKSESHFVGNRFEAMPIISADRHFVAVNVKAVYSQWNSLFRRVPVTSTVFPPDDQTKKLDPVIVTQYVDEPNFSKVSAENSGNIPVGSTMMFVAGKMMVETSNEFERPVVAKIPYLNRLFKNVGYSKQAHTILICVTPRVIVNAEEPVKQAGCCAGGGTSALIRGTVGSDCEKSESCVKPCPSSKSAPFAAMNLADIVALSSSGVSDEIIINQIQTTQATFTLATEDILFLKKNKVSDKVVIEMQNSRGRNDPAIVPVAAQMMPPMPYHYQMPFLPSPQYYPVPFTMPMPAPVYPPAPPALYPQYQPVPQPAYAPPQSCLPSPTICPVGGYGPPPWQPSYVPVMPVPIQKPVSRNEAAGDVGQFLIDLVTDLVEITADIAGGIADLFVEPGDINLEFKISPTPPAVQPSVKMPKLINQLESQKKSFNGIRAWRYPNDPNERCRQLLNESDHSGQIPTKPKKSWMNGSPAPNYDRLSGSIGPG